MRREAEEIRRYLAGAGPPAWLTANDITWLRLTECDSRWLADHALWLEVLLSEGADDEKSTE